jgi:hypothetical protein
MGTAQEIHGAALSRPNLRGALIIFGAHFTIFFGSIAQKSFLRSLVV